MKEELKQYLEENLYKNSNRKKLFKNFITRIKDVSKTNIVTFKQLFLK